MVSRTPVKPATPNTLRLVPEPPQPGAGNEVGAPKRRHRPLLRILGAALATAVLAVVAIAGLALSTGRWQATPVLSGSMRPGFSVGGLVISQRVPVTDLAVRDVILFQRPDEPSQQMVHRIIAIKHDRAGHLMIRTQGDANSAPDPWTVQIRGSSVYVARWSVPLVGYVAVAFQNHRGVVLLIAGIIALALAASFGLGAKKHDRTDPSADEVNAAASPSHGAAVADESGGRHARSPRRPGWRSAVRAVITARTHTPHKSATTT